MQTKHKRALIRFSPLSLLLLLGTFVAGPLAAPLEETSQPIPKRWSVAFDDDLVAGTAPLASSPQSVIPLTNTIIDNTDIVITTATNRTLSENSIAAHPLDNQILLCANNSTDWNGASVNNLFGTHVGWSTDGGLTWTNQTQGPGGQGNRGDPAAVIDRNGTFFVGYIDQARGQGVSFSNNTGASWSHVTVASLPGPGETTPPRDSLLDKNHLAVDNSASSPFVGRLYSAWTEFVSGSANDNDIVLSFSTDGGSTWSGPTNISNGVTAGSHNQGVNIQTGPNGEVYAVWAIYDSWPSDEVALGFNRSTTGAASWAGETRILTNIRGIRQTTVPNENTRTNSFPSMAVDVSGGARNGSIYAFWTNVGVPGTNTGDADIYMVRSTDGGATWTSAIRVNNDATTNAQWFPWASCDPETGDLWVIFYDRRDDAGDLLTAPYLAHSTDGGTTWENIRIGDVQFTPSSIPGLASGYMGDYLGVVAAGGCMVYPIWSDNRTGFFTAYTSPINSDEVPPTITCRPDTTVECTTAGGAPVTDPAIQGWLAGVTASDNCPGVSVDNDAPAFFAVNTTTTVTFTATDAAGNTNTCTADLSIVDNTPPVITVAMREVLWPPNHKMVDITPTVVVTDICDPNPTFVLVSITSNEPDNDIGDGNTVDDIQFETLGTDDVAFQLRSERRGGGDGRKYRVIYTASDADGNTASNTTFVCVPHDQSGGAIAATGFNITGDAFEAGATQFAIVIPSMLDQMAIQEIDIMPSDIQTDLTAPSSPPQLPGGLDAATIETHTAYIGNTAGVMTPMRRQMMDVDRDGLDDVVFFYRVDAAQQILGSADDLDGPLGLHFRTEGGQNYLVPLIFDIGSPVLLPGLIGGPGGPQIGANEEALPEPGGPARTALAGIFPNPVHHGTTVAFTIASRVDVQLNVYDLRGARVRTLENRAFEPGRYQVAWNGRDDGGRQLPRGVYFVHFSAGDVQNSRRVVLMR